MKNFEDILNKISTLIWGDYLMAILLGTGLFFTILTKGIQFRGFLSSIRELISSIKAKDIDKLDGTVSPIQALCTALSSCMGNGNIVGVATAIASGGSGAIFWMWVSAILGMATKYAEILLGIVYREKDNEGNYYGGPMYYIAKGIGLKYLAIFFSILMLFQISSGALIQSNAVSLVLKDILGFSPIISGLLISSIIYLVIKGGVINLAKISEKLVPIMSFIYILGGLIIIISNIGALKYAIISIVKNAFSSSAVIGGGIGYTIREAIRFGLARGLYSNEAGEGSAPVLHSVAKTNHPAKQGLFGIVEVFIDTIIMCSFTALIVLVSDTNSLNISSALFIMRAFSTIHPYLKYVIGFSMFLFAFSSILAQWYFGNVALTYIFNKKIAEKFKYIFVLLTILGPLATLKSVWFIQDILLGIMILPNLFAIIYLYKDVYFYTEDYFKKINIY